MKYLRYYSLLAFSMTLGFLVVGVEDAKVRQDILLNELKQATGRLQQDTEPLPGMIALTKIRLGIDYRSPGMPVPATTLTDPIGILRDTEAEYEKYLMAKHRFDFFWEKLDSLPVPPRGWEYITVPKNAQDSYIANTLIQDTFNILRVSSPPINVKLNIMIDGKSIPQYHFPLHVQQKIREIQIQFQNPVTGEDFHFYQTMG